MIYYISFNVHLCNNERTKKYVVTYVPEFFKKAGFRVIDKKKLPHKIWNECIRCVYFPNCKEVALIKEI